MQMIEWLTDIGLSHYLILSALLFTIGMMGVLFRQNTLAILMGIQLMLGAVNLSFVAFASLSYNLNGQIISLLTIMIAFAEVGVGLALVLAIYKQHKKIDVRSYEQLRG